MDISKVMFEEIVQEIKRFESVGMALEDEKWCWGDISRILIKHLRIKFGVPND